MIVPKTRKNILQKSWTTIIRYFQKLISSRDEVSEYLKKIFHEILVIFLNVQDVQETIRLIISNFSLQSASMKPSIELLWKTNISLLAGFHLGKLAYSEYNLSQNG